MTSSTARAGRFRNRHGLVLTYQVLGEGPILVCHPGGPGFSASYVRDVGGLDRHRTLVLLNPRGTGGSERPRDPEAYEIDDYVNDLEDLRGHLGLEAFDLLGQSHGGVVVMDYAARYPRRVRRLVLVTTLARFAGAPKEAMEAAMRRREREPWYADAVAAVAEEQAGHFATDAEAGALWDREVYLYFKSIGDVETAYIDEVKGEPVNADALRLFNRTIFETFDLRSELPRITSPTLVIVGDDDFITGPVAGSEIVEGIPGARMTTLPGGHFVFVEARDAFREAVREFLEGT